MRGMQSDDAGNAEHRKRLARRTRALVYQNLLFSALYSKPAPQSGTSTSARSTP